MLSTSFPRELAAYFTSRLLVGRVVCLWLALSASILILSHEKSLAYAAFGILMIAALIVQFRLWDDLVDRDIDAVLHPHRVIVTTDYVRYFARFCYLLTLPVAVFLGFVSGMLHLIIYGLLLVAISVLYAVPRVKLSKLLRAHLVLLKYPIIIWLCTFEANPVQWACFSTAVYLAICMFELFSDASLRNVAAWRVLVLIEVAVLVVLQILFIRNFS